MRGARTKHSVILRKCKRYFFLVSIDWCTKHRHFITCILQATSCVLFPSCRGAALEKRREDREKEMEADMRDRRREAEEIHEIKRRLKEEGSENLDEELARVS